MANNRSLTAANALITLSVAGLYSTPQQLQGFSADNIYDIGTQEQGQSLMGVDGHLSAGFVYAEVEQTFTLQADSLSVDLFENITASQKANGTVYEFNGRTTLIAVGKSYVMTRGFLISAPPMPQAARILQPRKFTIHWESISANPS